MAWQWERRGTKGAKQLPTSSRGLLGDVQLGVQRFTSRLGKMRERRGFSSRTVLLLLAFFTVLIFCGPRSGELSGKEIIPVAVSRASLEPDKFRDVLLEDAVAEVTRDRPLPRAGPPRTTLIACCRDRLEDLQTALGTWVNVRGLDEILLLDWGSEDLHRFATIAHPDVDPRIISVAVTDTGSWALTRAYNLAAKFARGTTLLKVDCDTLLDASFLERNTVGSNRQYLTASWSEARSANDQPLRGVLLLSRAHFLSVGGFDERLREYGYEEMDLFGRLKTRLHLHEKALDLRTIYHRPHRTRRLVSLTTHELIPKLSARVNALSLQKLDVWPATKSGVVPSTYRVQFSANSYLIKARPLAAPPTISELLNQADRISILNAAEQTMLHDEYGLPWDVISELSDFDFDLMLEVMYDNGEKLMMVDAQGILPNRLVALTNAVAMAIRLERSLIIAWGDSSADGAEEDADIASVSDLFDLQKTNARIRDQTGKDIFIFSITKWSCRLNVADCMEVDNAYNSFVEVTMTEETTYLANPKDKHIVINGIDLANWDLLLDSERLEALRLLIPSASIAEYVEQNGSPQSQTLLYADLPSDETVPEFVQWFHAHHPRDQAIDRRSGVLSAPSNVSSSAGDSLFLAGHHIPRIHSLRTKLHLSTIDPTVQQECRGEQWVAVGCLQHAVADLWTAIMVPGVLNEQLESTPFVLPESVRKLRRIYRQQRELGVFHFAQSDDALQRSPL